MSLRKYLREHLKVYSLLPYIAESQFVALLAAYLWFFLMLFTGNGLFCWLIPVLSFLYYLWGLYLEFMEREWGDFFAHLVVMVCVYGPMLVIATYCPAALHVPPDVRARLEMAERQKKQASRQHRPFPAVPDVQGTTHHPHSPSRP